MAFCTIFRERREVERLAELLPCLTAYSILLAISCFWGASYGTRQYMEFETGKAILCFFDGSPCAPRCSPAPS